MEKTIKVLEQVYNSYYTRVYEQLARDWAGNGFPQLVAVKENEEDDIIEVVRLFDDGATEIWEYLR